MKLLSFKHSQKAALFGLDARIALVIYTILSAFIAFSAMSLFISVDYTKVLADTDVISKGVKLYMEDMNGSISQTVESSLTQDEKDLAMFQNLISNTGVITKYRNKWNGPYITLKSGEANEPTLGVPYRLAKLSNTLSTTCGAANNPCFIFLKFKKVPTSQCTSIDSLVQEQKLKKLNKVNVTGGCDLFLKLSADYK